MTESLRIQAFENATAYASDRAAGNVQSMYVAKFDAAANAIELDGHDMGSQTLDMATQEPAATAEANVDANVVRDAFPSIG